MKLFHDDIRRAPADWFWARTNDEAMEFLRNNPCEEASLDHDLGMHDIDPDIPDADTYFAGNWSEEDGTHLVRQMIEEDLVPAKVTIHSHNPDGAKRMARLLNDVGVKAIIKPFRAP